MISIIIIVGVGQGLTRSNKCCPGPVRDGNGRKVLTRVGKCWHGPAWSNKGKKYSFRFWVDSSCWKKNNHSDDIDFKDYHELNYQDTLSFYINMSHPGELV